MASPLGILCLTFATIVGSVPLTDGNSKTDFIGKGTNELATALLQGFVHQNSNMVYSPFGYSAIMAVFSEGARGVSREEIVNALHFPSEPKVVREAYRSVLETLSSKKFSNAPEFKNWFYVYKNYTVNEELENVLRKYYLTEVKTVDRPEDYIGGRPGSQMREKTEEKAALPETPAEVKKEMEDVKTEEVKPMEKSSVVENVVKPMSSVVEEVVKKEKAEKLGEGEKVKMMEPIKTEASDGVVPTEHFSGMTDSCLRIKGQDQTPKMLIFNGLFYKGEWETPFVKKPADDSRAFYKSETEKVFVSTIHSQGVFNHGSIPNLDCRAIELPYKGGRYSLLVLVPNTRNGLTKLISDLSGYTLNRVYEQLTEKLVDVCLPSFQVNSITRPVSPDTKLGLTKVTSIFKPETADLSGISNTDAGLFVEELVQVVTFKVDATYSEANFLTASVASSRSNIPKFQINQPFLFYLRDNLEDIIIVNGKVVDPTPSKSIF